LELKRVLAIVLGMVLTLSFLLSASCSKKGGKHVFLKMYTSCNMIGSLEPCG